MLIIGFGKEEINKGIRVQVELAKLLTMQEPLAKYKVKRMKER